MGSAYHLTPELSARVGSIRGRGMPDGYQRNNASSRYSFDSS
jgi:hypothetical protein